MAKYINTAMAIEALEKGLNVWIWNTRTKAWHMSNLSSLTYSPNTDNHFAIGEMPTSPPRNMIQIDGVRMPAPIMRVEDCSETFYVLWPDNDITPFYSAAKNTIAAYVANGFAFSTRDDAIAARDARKLILERALERAK